MSPLQILGKEAPKLALFEVQFWAALKNPQFQVCWNLYRREMLAAAATSVSDPVPGLQGHERTFRLFDRTFVARFTLALAEPGENGIPLAVGVISFFQPSNDDHVRPFYQLFFESNANFGTSPFELNAASLSTAGELTGLFEAMAETAIRSYFILPNRPG
jgi:hypothetical protein